MYSKEEAKSIRSEFWDRFKGYSSIRRRQKGQPERWILDRTGIKALNLKFYIDRNAAIVGIDVETNNIDKRIEIFEKLISLKSLLEKAMGTPMIWELDFIRENGKSVSRVFLQLEGVDIYRKEDWPVVFRFFYTNMMKLESFYDEYREFLR